MYEEQKMTDNSLAVIIVAGGKGSRMRADIPKQFLKIGDKEIIEYTLESFIESGVADKIFVVCHNDYMTHMKDIISKYADSSQFEIVSGGSTRQESVYNGLVLAKSYKYVMIHDAVRCCITSDEIIKLYSLLTENGACALGVRVKDTIKRTDSIGNISDTISRDNLWQIQTPQAFITDDILNAHIDAMSKKISVTDDCALAEITGQNVRIVEGSYNNIKITTPEDMFLAELILKRQ